MITALMQASNMDDVYPLTHFRDVHNSNAFKRAGLRLVKKYNKQFDNYTKLLVVRNPIDRAISAYNNIRVGLKNLGPEKYVYNSLRKAFPKASTNMGRMDRMSFEEYMTFLTQRQLTKETVFEDRHFSPMFQTCDPCRIKYDYFLRLETFADDSAQLYSFLNVSQQFIDSVPASMNSAVNKNPLNSQEQNHEKTSKQHLIFKSVPTEEVDMFLKRFAFDFSLFGYKYNRTSFTSSCENDTPTNCC